MHEGITRGLLISLIWLLRRHICRTEGDGGDDIYVCVCAHVFARDKMHKFCGKDACAVLTNLVQSCVLCKADVVKC